MDAALSAAAEYLRGRLPNPPAVGVILGSGLGEFADLLADSITIPYGEIPGFPQSSVIGHAGKLVAGSVRGVPVAVLSGRVHYYEGQPMSAVIFPARVLGLLGCRDVIVTNAAGGIDRSFRPGDLMLITDHINGFGTNPLVGANDEDLGPRFPDMSDAYRKELRAIALKVARRERIPLRQGIYVGLHGPSYETPAEIRAFHALGAHAVGMSTVPEVIALNQMGIGVVGLSCITNMAAGVLPQKLVHTEVLETTERVKHRIVQLLTALVEAIGVGRSGEVPPDEPPPSEVGPVAHTDVRPASPKRSASSGKRRASASGAKRTTKTAAKRAAPKSGGTRAKSGAKRRAPSGRRKS
jgi:purine-nucleoside phosphorylase